jgi:trimeric autotransporter adhesin
MSQQHLYHRFTLLVIVNSPSLIKGATTMYRIIVARFIPFLLVLLVLAGLAPARSTAATSVRGDLWVTNGRVYSVAVAGTTLYIGGDFTEVSSPTGSFVGLSAGDGSRDPAVPAVGARITAAAADGQGGWYIGTQALGVGGHSQVALLHIRADKTLDPNWHPTLEASDLVIFAMAANSSTVFIGGQFQSVNGQPQVNMAAVDAITGQLKPWNPAPVGMIDALAASDTTVYVSGSFSAIGGQPRSGIAALDATSGLATLWNPGANDPGTDHTVYTLAIRGETVYAGGGFSTIGGQPRNGIATLDATSGLATSWNPGALGTVFSLALGESAIYIGGDFSSVDGLPQASVAAIDIAPKRLIYLPLLIR